ncbi:MAG: hypothetical protein U0169_02295 [Polyangiaceae bacterium]
MLIRCLRLHDAQLFAASAIFVMACGGSAPPPAAAPPPPPATQDVASLTLFVKPTRHPAVDAALRSAFVGAGYALASDAKAKHDVDGEVAVTATPERSMVSVSVNGESQAKSRFSVALTLSAEGRVLDNATVEFVAPDREVSEPNVRPLVAAIGTSGKLAAFATERRSRQEQKAHDVSEKAAEAKRIQEETDWNNAHAPGCKLPTALNACDAVRVYVARYPNGAHTEEAKAALRDGDAAMAPLQKDENAWKASGAAECLTAMTSDACAGVEVYATKYPAGLHAEQARKLLRR